MAKMIRTKMGGSTSTFKQGVNNAVGGIGNNRHQVVSPSTQTSQGLDDSETGLNGNVGQIPGNQYSHHTVVKPNSFKQNVDAARVVEGNGGKMVDATNAIGPKTVASRRPRRGRRF